MQILKSVLLEALKRASSGVGNTPLLQGGDTFVFKDGFIHTFNSAISVSVPFKTPEPLEGAVKAKEFLAIVSKLPVEELKVVTTPDKWVIKAGAATLELSLLEGSVLDSVKGISPAGEWQALPDTFVEAMATCLFGRNTSPLSGIVVSEGIMVSTDEFRINQFTLPCEVVVPFWISDPAAIELLKLKDITDYQVSGPWVNFLSRSNIIFSAKLLNFDKFPFKQLCAVVAKTKQAPEDFGHALPSGLPGALDRASTLSMDLEKMTALRLTFEKKGILVSTERTTGKYKESVVWDVPLETDPGKIEVLVDAGMMNQGIAKSKTFYIKETKIKSGFHQQVVFAGPNFFQIVSAISAPEKKE